MLLMCLLLVVLQHHHARRELVNMLMNVKDMTSDFSSFIPKRIAREINEFRQ